MNFFEYMQNASTEKVHSQFIAWLFSKDNLAISHKQKIELLFLITGSELDKNDNITNVYTEKDQVDITIELEKQVVIIENKIKISQRINQLKDYQESAKASYPKHKKHFVLLSLVDEEPDSVSWNKFTYIKFLDKGLEKLNFLDHSHKYILKEYRDGLRELTYAIESFIDNPNKMPGVFTESNKKKYQKNIEECYGEKQKYILRNNLETICQKYLYSKIIKKEKDNFNLPIVKETRGKALIDLKNPKDKKSIKIDGYEFEFGIQIQGGSIKLQIESGYNNDGKRKDIPKKTMSKMAESLRNHGETIHKTVNDLKTENNWRYNKSKSKAKAYMSVSKKIHFSDGKEFYEHDYKEMKNAFTSEIYRCKKVIHELSKLNFSNN